MYDDEDREWEDYEEGTCDCDMCVGERCDYCNRRLDDDGLCPECDD